MSKRSGISEWQIDEIADPFDVFPLSDALRRLGKLIEEYKDDLYSQYEDVAPKYRHIGLEMGLEGVSIIIGTGFVAAQSILTRTFSKVKKLSDLDIVKSVGGASLPKVIYFRLRPMTGMECLTFLELMP